ncbi:MAG: hypothetical protein K9L78_04780 [Victivallales bacterium]|nr:hypothetical protein [Victivallales bacterium]MCF7889418.1 hypothetical protein [Victivallales bacterium]
MFKKKISYFILFTFIFIIFSSDGAENIFKSIRVKLSTAATPIFFVQNVPNKIGNKRRGKWVLINIEYKAFPADSIVNSDLSDKINCNFAIKVDTLVTGRKNNFHLSNTARYVTIDFNNKKKYALFLIPPQILGKVISKNKTPDSDFLKRNIMIKISFSLKGKNSAFYYYPENRSVEKTFQDSLNSKNTIRIDGGLLNRMQSPWSLISFNKYELLKLQ